jgi:putative ABC transport system substrate-binding protein
MWVRSLRRREFITVFGAAAASSISGHAQQGERMRRVGVLVHWPENHPSARASVAALASTLAGLGWVEGKNLRIDFRFAAGDPTLYEKYAAELVGFSPDVVLASITLGLAAVRAQTRTIPIVFVAVSEPVNQGFVHSLARPGGNITGFTDADAALHAKWLQLLKDVAPATTRVTVIFNPETVPFAPLLNDGIETAAASIGLAVRLAPLRDDTEIEEAIASQSREPGGGLIAWPSPFFQTHDDVLVTAAVHHRLPLVSGVAVTRAGGLMTYWIDPIKLYAQAASYVDRILRGANPADLPVQQPTKYSLIINLKTATALGLTVPPSMLDLADEVIE